MGQTNRASAHRAKDDQERRARKAEAVMLWGSMTLSGVGILTVLTLWHLSRRARILRERLGPPRDVRLVDPLAPDAGERPDPS